MEHRPIAITGMHRSGTSMITRGLHESGLLLLGSDAEKFIDAADDNPEGFWENAAIVACNDDLLEATGGAWDNPPELPPQGADDPRVAGVADAAASALAGLRAHDHWGFKDPRTCLTAAYWLDLEPELRFIVCVRHPLEVALSLKRRNQNSYSLGLALWERYYATVLELVPSDRRVVTHYDTFFTDPKGELRRLCDFAGLEAVEPRVRSELRHHTIDVSLADAGVSPSLQALYADLCREAGAPIPSEPASDDARVRRLILDGAVARRHADQRKDALDRLEDRLRERETQLQHEKAALEANLRTRMRELEVQVADTMRGISDIEQLTRHTAARVDAAVQTVTMVRARRLLRRWARAARSRARAKVLRPGKEVAGRTKQAAVPRARVVARRLPQPVQQTLRRGRKVISPVRKKRPSAPSAGVRPATSSKPSTPSKSAAVPAPKELRKQYEQLVASAVTDGNAWLVIAPGSPRWARRARSRPGASFPDKASARPDTVDLSYIAQLEGLRFQGYGRLVVPPWSRSWFAAHVELREHVGNRYRAVADETAATIFDLERRADTGARLLRTVVAELSTEPTGAPAILDWTELDIASELPGVTTFRPPAGANLPYADASVEVVVVDAPEKENEAVRVASVAVITAAPEVSGMLSVRSIELTAERSAPVQPRTLVWSADPQRNERWQRLLSESVAEAGADLRLADIDAAGFAAIDDYDVVVVVEPYVLPLPGAVATAATRSVADPTTAVAGKVLRRDGRLEAAGGTVFFDRSVGLIGNGSRDVSASWHEFVRPVCWAPGIVAAATKLWKHVDRPDYVFGRAFVREWCSEVWASGHRVIYDPAVIAVGLLRDSGEPSIPLDSSAWQRVLDLRPRRPRELHDGTWRYLLAHDDVEACRG